MTSSFKRTRSGKDRGVAILLALVMIMIMTFIAVEVSYDTNVEYLVANHEIQNMKAYYAAKAGMELSLLRIRIYLQAENAGLRKQLGPQSGMLDMIWNLPVGWPPDKGLPSTLSAIDQAAIKDVLKDTKMDAEYQPTITSEGSKIDINDLGSPADSLARVARTQILEIWRSRIDQDDEWAREHRDFPFEKLLDNIADWVDLDDRGRTSGDERSAYSDVASDIQIPPNEPLKTIEELHMIAEMTDEIFNFLLPYITIYGSKSIAVNYASKTLLMSIDRQITEKIADEIITRRSDPQIGPFDGRESFEKFMNSQGINVERSKFQWPPLSFDAEHYFRIKSRGQFGKASREIVAIVYDFAKVRSTVASLVVTPTPASPAGGPTPTPPQVPASGAVTPTPTPTPPPSGNGRPNVVYWNEY